ncbi:hypothetical protein RIF29_28176 [Crotalaria pallida]|uniref:Uncharacterized protein n=1 Tax=Crotalaria pallida TaxID=3830 RepID=A0AAN9ERG1_CROPI
MERGQSSRSRGGVDAVIEHSNMVVQPEERIAHFKNHAGSEDQSFFAVEVTNDNYNNNIDKLISSFRNISQVTKCGYILRGELMAYEQEKPQSRIFLLFEDGVSLKLIEKDHYKPRLKELLCALYYLFNILGSCHSNLVNYEDSLVFSRGSAKLATFISCRNSEECLAHRHDDFSSLIKFFKIDSVIDSDLKYFLETFPIKLLQQQTPLEVLLNHPIWLTPLNRLYARILLRERLSLLNRRQYQKLTNMCYILNPTYDWMSWRSHVTQFPNFNKVYEYIPGPSPSSSTTSRGSPTAP